MVPKVKEGRDEFGMNKYILLYIKQINNNVLLYSTGNYIQYLIITYSGTDSEKEYKKLCIYKKCVSHSVLSNSLLSHGL